MTQLQPGTYTAIVEHPGFQKVVEAPFQLTVSQVVTLDIGLTIGRVDQVVNVTASEPLLESGTSSVGQVITAGPITSLPLNGRDFIQLAYLTPGVNQGPSGIVQQGSIPENERANGAIQANGLNATNNNFLLDGFDNNEQQIGFELIQPSVDAIAEFKMQTSSFAADIGKGGAVVNVALKSGTNQFHGDAFGVIAIPPSTPKTTSIADQRRFRPSSRISSVGRWGARSSRIEPSLCRLPGHSD